MKKYVLSQFTGHLYHRSRSLCSNTPLDVLPEIKNGLASGKPIVALESTIITHGMPYPHNLKTAKEVEEIVRSQGAIPATIAILGGTLKVGLSDEDLNYLAKPDTPVIKSSRRDFPYVLSKKLNGGTTVSGTLLVCSKVGIKIFVTGGIGGVHRDGQTSLDISADLTELGRHSIAVISSGVKSILDIGRTLEYLETQGVCVATFGETNDFPAFYCRDSGYKSQYHVKNITDAAKLVESLVMMNSKSGLLLANPVPEQSELIKKEDMDKVIQKALSEMKEQGIAGKDVTPFLLKAIADATKGKSLETNIALIKNNALVGSQIAVELSKLNSDLLSLHGETQKSVLGGKKVSTENCAGISARISVENSEKNAESGSSQSSPSASKVVVIGGAMMDITVKSEDDMKFDGRTLNGRLQQSCGGVARNLADAIGRLIDDPPIFISAVGDDLFGKTLVESLPHVDTGAVIKSEKDSACCSAILDNSGECLFIVAAMDVFQDISPHQISRHENLIRESKYIVFDGNTPLKSMEVLLQISRDHNIPVWFEPTDITLASKPFKTKLFENITYISPNIYELLEISKTLNEGRNLRFEMAQSNPEDTIRQAVEHSLPLLDSIPNIMVTLGTHGSLIISRGESGPSIHHYKPLRVSKVVSVMGAGDCLAAGFIAGLVRGHSEGVSMAAGLNAASLAIQSQFTVSPLLRWVQCEAAPFTTLQSAHFGHLRR
nr:PREDICTED: pseudouridine-metabolizing bifunctional protein C1861.05 [Bemisia tabaci]XP_018909221.1 PREDICTED: pseudouridine-metabolizing bifunctional protein C1861.05 [Bemisia tabaci]